MPRKRKNSESVEPVFSCNDIRYHGSGSIIKCDTGQSFEFASLISFIVLKDGCSWPVEVRNFAFEFDRAPVGISGGDDIAAKYEMTLRGARFGFDAIIENDDIWPPVPPQKAGNMVRGVTKTTRLKPL